jgi:hypothetical protein
MLIGVDVVTLVTETNVEHEKTNVTRRFTAVAPLNLSATTASVREDVVEISVMDNIVEPSLTIVEIDLIATALLVQVV